MTSFYLFLAVALFIFAGVSIAAGAAEVCKESYSGLRAYWFFLVLPSFSVVGAYNAYEAFENARCTPVASEAPDLADPPAVQIDGPRRSIFVR